MLAAVAALFPATPRQRCLVHKQRNVLNAIPQREQQDVITELTGIWKQENKESALLNLAAFKAKYQKRYPEAVRSRGADEEHLLTFYAFPAVMHRYIRSTNAIESLFSHVRQRTDQIDAFTRRYELPDHCVGGDAGYSPAQDSRRLIAEAGEVEVNQQPAGKAGSGEAFLCGSACANSRVLGSLFVTRWESGAGFCCVLRA